MMCTARLGSIPVWETAKVVRDDGGAKTEVKLAFVDTECFI